MESGFYVGVTLPATDRPVTSEQLPITDVDEHPNDILEFVPYKVPETVPLGEFDFSGYVILVKDVPEEFYRDEYYDGEEDKDYSYPVREKYAIIGQGVNALAQGHEYYDRLNSLYYTTYMPTAASILSRDDLDDCIRAYFSRNVVYISDSGNRVMCQSPGVLAEFLYANANGNPILYEFFEGERMIHTTTTEGWYYPDFFRPDPSLTSYTYFDDWKESVYFNLDSDTTSYVGVHDPQFWDNCSVMSGGKEYAIFNKSAEEPNLIIYAMPEYEQINSVSLNHISKIQESFRFVQIINKDVIACTVEVSLGTSQTSVQTWLYNIMDEEKTLIGYYLYNRVFSPDGRYVAYTAPTLQYKQAYHYGDSAAENALYGFYILDLKTNKTVFYETSSKFSEIVCWSTKEGVDRLLKN
jgi:hypothetical protein